MDEAKMIWRLSNGELVEIEDKVQITTSDDEVYVGNIIDIGETYITAELDYKTGEELDVFFSELKDVRLIKQLLNDCFIRIGGTGIENNKKKPIAEPVTINHYKRFDAIYKCYCPNCSRILNRNEDKCSCGQEIDWSEWQ